MTKNELFVVKRNGKVVPFNGEKIKEAIGKAFHAVEDNPIPSTCIHVDNLSNLVVEKVLEKFSENSLSVEEVQNYVCYYLSNVDDNEEIISKLLRHKIHTAYANYRHDRDMVRSKSETTVDVNEVIDGYLDESNWRVHENSNIDMSYQGLILHCAGIVQKKYVLSKYSKAVRDAHTNGFIHIHDLAYGLTGYCAGWSLRDLLLEGLHSQYTAGCASGPAKHFDSICGQIPNFLGTLQNEWA